MNTQTLSLMQCHSILTFIHTHFILPYSSGSSFRLRYHSSSNILKELCKQHTLVSTSVDKFHQTIPGGILGYMKCIVKGVGVMASQWSKYWWCFKHRNDAQPECLLPRTHKTCALCMNNTWTIFKHVHTEWMLTGQKWQSACQLLPPKQCW